MAIEVASVADLTIASLYLAIPAPSVYFTIPRIIIPAIVTAIGATRTIIPQYSTGNVDPIAYLAIAGLDNI